MTAEHKLENELPEFKDQIEKLKASDNHFANLFQRYQSLNDQIIKMERGGHFVDNELENLKKQRLELKDQFIKHLEANKD